MTAGSKDFAYQREAIVYSGTLKKTHSDAPVPRSLHLERMRTMHSLKKTPTTRMRYNLFHFNSQFLIVCFLCYLRVHSAMMLSEWNRRNYYGRIKMIPSKSRSEMATDCSVRTLLQNTPKLRQSTQTVQQMLDRQGMWPGGATSYDLWFPMQSANVICLDPT